MHLDKQKTTSARIINPYCLVMRNGICWISAQTQSKHSKKSRIHNYTTPIHVSLSPSSIDYAFQLHTYTIINCMLRVGDQEHVIFLSAAGLSSWTWDHQEPTSSLGTFADAFSVLSFLWFCFGSL